MSLETSIANLNSKVRHVQQLIHNQQWRQEYPNILRSTNESEFIFTTLLSNCSLQQVFQVITSTDANVQKQMNPSCKSFKILGTIQAFPLIHTTIEIGVPFVADRDFLFVSSVTQTQNTITICNCSLTEQDEREVYLEESNSVRGRIHYNAWIIQKEDSKVRVYCTSKIEMGGWIPSSAMKNASRELSHSIRCLSNYTF